MSQHAVAEQRVKLGFLIHLGAYVVVVSSLMTMNIMRHPDRMWSLWVAAGWGLGVAAHGVLVAIPGTRERMVERTEQRLEFRSQRRQQHAARRQATT